MLRKTKKKNKTKQNLIKKKNPSSENVQLFIEKQHRQNEGEIDNAGTREEITGKGITNWGDRQIEFLCKRRRRKWAGIWILYKSL